MIITSFQETTRAEPLRAGADLDGVYLTIGPAGSAVYTEDHWQGAFGGELGAIRVREASPLAGMGIWLGGARFSDRDAGRLWAEGLVATRWPLDLGIGLSAGLTAEVDRVVPPRYGGQATLWVFAGIIPYVRVGVLERAGGFVELGFKLAIPAVRL